MATPYDSFSSIAKEKFPILPINLILKHKFDSISRAPQIESPLLILAATEDTTIPNWHSKKLAEKWGGEVTYEEFVGQDHNSICRTDEYWDKIKNFLANLQ